MKTKAVLLNEIRYAERLAERTARLYRNLQVAGTFATVVSGSSVLAALGQNTPPWVSLTGASVFVVFGALMVAISPANKAAANEADRKRYARLLADAGPMTEQDIETAIAKAAEGNAQEIEALRAVAYNDVACEIGRPDECFRLTLGQRALAALA